jgi:SAM-dependent methyltransferase
MAKARVAEFFDATARQRDAWKAKNAYYHAAIEGLCASLVEPGHSVLEVGCSTGDLLHAVKPARGVGLDISPGAVRVAAQKYPQYEFLVDDAETLALAEVFDYVLMSDLLGYLDDVWAALQALKQVTKPSSRVVLTFYNPLWRPILALGERLRMKTPYGPENWLTPADVEAQLALADFEIEHEGSILLWPRRPPGLNRRQSPAPDSSRTGPRRYRGWLRNLCLVHYAVARPTALARGVQDLSCSVIVPCRNEVENVRGAVERTPEIGRHTEIIFVDGASTDGTVAAIESLMEEYDGRRDVKLIHQVQGQRSGSLAADTPDDLMLSLGKGDAVRKGFAAAQGVRARPSL